MGRSDLPRGRSLFISPIVDAPWVFGGHSDPALSLTAVSKDTADITPTMRLNEQEETGRIIEMQRLEIRRLRDQIQEQEQVPGFHTIAGVRLPSLIDSEVDFEMHTK